MMAPESMAPESMTHSRPKRRGPTRATVVACVAVLLAFAAYLYRAGVPPIQIVFRIFICIVGAYFLRRVGWLK